MVEENEMRSIGLNNDYYIRTNEEASALFAKKKKFPRCAYQEKKHHCKAQMINRLEHIHGARGIRS
jgi:hypothetical protein